MYLCEECGRAFTRKDNMLAHCRSETRRPARRSRWFGKSEKGEYICGECQRTYQSYSALHNHYQATHTDNRFQCQQCNQSFNRSDNLVHHMLKYIQCNSQRAEPKSTSPPPSPSNQDIPLPLPSLTTPPPLPPSAHASVSASNPSASASPQSNHPSAPSAHASVSASNPSASASPQSNHPSAHASVSASNLSASASPQSNHPSAPSTPSAHASASASNPSASASPQSQYISCSNPYPLSIIFFGGWGREAAWGVRGTWRHGTPKEEEAEEATSRNRPCLSQWKGTKEYRASNQVDCQWSDQKDMRLP